MALLMSWINEKHNHESCRLIELRMCHWSNSDKQIVICEIEDNIFKYNKYLFNKKITSQKLNYILFTNN